MKEYKIYTLAHPITNEVRYVGFTTYSLKERLSGHYSCFKGGNNYKENWIKSLIRQGLKPTIELLEIVQEENWVEREIYWIEQFRQWEFRLVNTSLGGDKNNLGLKKPEGWISPKSKAIKQYSMKGEFIKEWPSAVFAARELSINKMSLGQACINNTTSRGFQWRFADNLTPITEWLGKYSRHVLQYSLDGNFIKEWSTVEEASKTLNLKHSNIFKNLKKERLSAGGYIWKYINDDSDTTTKKDTNGYNKKVSITYSNGSIVVYSSQKLAAESLNMTNKALWAIMNSKAKIPQGNKQTKDKTIKYV